MTEETKRLKALLKEAWAFPPQPQCQAPDGKCEVCTCGFQMWFENREKLDDKIREALSEPRHDT